MNVAVLNLSRGFPGSGTQQVAAGYVLYGSSTVFVITTGHGVHMFELDMSVDEALKYIISMGVVAPPAPHMVERDPGIDETADA